MASHADTPLKSVPGWSKGHAEKLAGHWITTAEQVVGVAGTPGGVRSLAEQLGVSVAEMNNLVERAKAALPPSVARELNESVDGQDYGLGALPPED